MTPRSNSRLRAGALAGLLLVPTPRGRQDPPVAELLAQFRATTLASRQFEVAKQIVKTGDRRAIWPLMTALGIAMPTCAPQLFTRA